MRQNEHASRVDDRVWEATARLLDDRFIQSHLEKPPVLLDFNGKIKVAITDKPDYPEQMYYEARAALGDASVATETIDWIECYGVVVTHDRHATYALKGRDSDELHPRLVEFERLDEIEQHPDVEHYELTEFTEDPR